MKSLPAGNIVPMHCSGNVSAAHALDNEADSGNTLVRNAVAGPHYSDTWFATQVADQALLKGSLHLHKICKCCLYCCSLQRAREVLFACGSQY